MTSTALPDNATSLSEIKPTKLVERSFLGLELIRFLSALAVVLWHYSSFFRVQHGNLLPGYSYDIQPLFSLFKGFYTNGQYGVVIFWEISGFIFCWKYADAIYARSVTAREFFVLRFSRLYPLHLVTLLLVAAMQWNFFRMFQYNFVYDLNDYYHFALQLFFASNWGFELNHSFNGPIWSVSLELLAYAVFFVMARLFHLRLLLLLPVFVVLSAVALFAHLPYLHPVCFLHFFSGVMLYLIVHKFESARWRLLAAIAICTGFSLAYAYAPPLFSLNLGFAGIATPLIMPSTFLLIGVTLAAGAVIVWAEPVIERTVLKKVFPALGNLTYASYLIHFPLQLAIITLTDAIGIRRAYYLHDSVLIAFIVIVFVGAYFVHQCFERPAQIYLRKKLM